MAARRTVSVALEVKAGDARRDIRGAATDVAKLEAAVVDTGHGLDRMSDKASKAGRGAEKAAAGTKTAKVEAEAYKRELGQLDRQIDATVLHLKVLGREFSDTGDKAVLGRIKAERAMLSQLKQIRNSLKSDLPDVGGGGGPGLPLTPVLIGTLLPIAAAALPGIGAAVAGAIVGGVGTGGIIGGIALANRDERVAAEFDKLKFQFQQSLTKAGDPFVAPLLASMNDLELAGFDLTNSLHAGFTTIAPVLTLVAHGVEGLVHNVGPGLAAAFEAAKPALRVIANELPEVGAALSDMFESIADEGDGATMGLLAIFHALEWVIRATGSFIGFLSGVFEWLVRTGNAFTDWALKVLDVADAFAFLGGPEAVGAVEAAKSHLTAMNTETDHLISGLDRAKDSSNDFSGSMMKVSHAEAEAAQKAQDLHDAFNRLFGVQMSLDEATLHYHQGLLAMNKELAEGKRTLNENTEEGQKNMAVVLAQINNIKDLRDASIEAGGGTEKAVRQANRAYGAQLESIRKTLLQLGFNKEAVNNLINAYKGIPPKAATEVQTPGLKTAETRLKNIENTLNRLDGTTTTTRFVTVYDAEYRAGERNPSARRWGGVTEHAATGTLRDAAVYSTRNPARYAFAEPATGGEAFVPKRGPYGRAMSILGTAAGWYGASVVPGGYMRASSGTQTIIHEHRHEAAPVSPEVLGRAVRSALQGMTVVMDRRVVGELTGRQADIYRRGG